ncbi:Protein lifeguard 1 [Rhodotorula toruloides]|nr:Protein lifeguard 1 [Rhodotorula toruloides]
MKRSYNSSNAPPSHPQSAPYGGGYATHSAPPLPPGPPPPPPCPGPAPDPYAAYGYGSGVNHGQQQGQQQQVMASHPQYPGYGYGTAAGPPTSTATPYSSVSVPTDANAAATAAQYAAYYAAYAQQASAAAAAANAAAGSPYQAAQSPYGAAGGPPFGAPGPPGPSGSPGAPPFKRTRYDQPPLPPSQPPLPPGPPPGPGGGYGNAPMPPSVLPPIGGASGRGPPPPRGPPMGRGPPPPRGGDQYGQRPGGDMPFGRDGPGMRGGPRGGPGPGPGPNRGPPGMGPGQFDDGMRGGPGGFGGQGPMTPLRGGPVGPRGGMRDDRRGGPPLGPGIGPRPGSGMGPSGPRGGMPPMPAPSNFNAPAGPRGLGAPNAPKGPKGASSRPTSGSGGTNVSANQQAARRERKWGSTSGGTSSTSSKKDRHATDDRGERDGESAKRTLTDFRIEGLAIPELEWEWRAERIEQEMRRAAEELDRQVKEKAEKEQQEQEASERGEPAKQEEDAGDMSVDIVNAEDVPAQPSDPTATATVAAGKHRRDEDDDSVQPNGASAEGSGGAEGADELAHASKPKKVRTGDVKSEDGEPVSLDSLHPPEKAPVKEANGDDEDGEPIKEEALEHEGEEEDVDGAPIDSAQTNGDEHDPTPVKGDTRSSPAPAPAPPRENSRLRIYFSSPTSSTSSYTQPSGSVPPRASSVSASVKSASVPPQAPQQEGTSATGGQVEPVPTPSVPADLIGEQLAKPVDGAEVMAKIEEEAEKDQAEQGTNSEGQVVGDAEGDAAAEHEQEPGDVEATEATAEAKEGAENDGEAHVDVQSEVQKQSELEQPQDAGGAATSEAEPQSKEELPTTAAQEPVRAPSAAPSAAPSTVEPVLVPPEPAADRISISYARNTRRMLLDADVIDEVKIKRGDGKIELTLRCKPAVLGEGERQIEDEFRVLKGVLVEALDVEADDYVVMDRTALTHSSEPFDESEDEHDLDPLLPPLHRLFTTFDATTNSAGTFSRDTITIVAQLDRLNPLTEARWVKTGDVDNWIVSLGISSGANPKETEKLSEWRNKIKVVDPDPPPTIQNALESWAASSSVGSRKERDEFVKTHMSNIDNVVEILLRLTRGDRAGPSHYSSAAQPPTVGALAATLSAPFPDQQTQVSLAVLAMFRLSMSTAEKAGIPKEEIERQVGEIIRGIPAHLQFKAVDGIFREVVKGHKGGSGGGGRGKKGGRRD